MYKKIQKGDRPCIIRSSKKISVNLCKLNKKSLAASYFPAKSSIIGVRELDFRVRNGNGYYLSTMTTRQKYKIKTKSVKPEKRCTPDEYNINGTDNMVKPHGLLVMLG